ncbi:hypothetical protein GPECTOR_20g428 [Gonium pectorale]|uniref:DEK-C domain-containing protein n=1 Tax=Gonium pectorale TaxID=33097 RepID=A0A150GID3_GONPE|nr:hypothetical protein GPECTOR_20g428 [Gonium pectorale]|eukprot:KXZ49573.1 hypothetical protein GPECTOR_20g428 [Gonium pectorale]
MALTTEESRSFAGKLDKYKEAKQLILEKWSENCTLTLSHAGIKEGWPEHLADILGPALAFLQEHGLVNFGAAQAAPEPPVPAAEEPKEEQQQEEKPKGVSKADVVARLYEILRTADLEVLSEKKIRAQLQADLGIDILPYKALVKKHVTHVIAHLDQRATLEPLPLTEDEGEGGQGGGGKAAKAAKGQPEAVKEPPHVVVVGAGLAGLAAASILKRNGVKVTVLEAQQSIGGRLAKLTSGLASDKSEGRAPLAFGPFALTCPLPAGGGEGAETASTSAAAWPSGAATLRLLCRQLHIALSPLSGGDGVSGGSVVGSHRLRLFERAVDGEEAASLGLAAVPEDVREEAERLLAELLSEVRQKLDEQLGDGKSAGDGGGAGPPGSLAAVLEAALAKLAGPPTPPDGGERPKGAAGAADEGASAEATGGGGAKRPAEQADREAAGVEGEQSAEDGDRPAKRGRTDGDDDGSASAAPNGENSDAAGSAGADGGQGGERAETVTAVQAAGPSGGDGQDVKMGAAEADGQCGAPEVTAPRVRQEVLRALRTHLLPLLELQLSAPLGSVAPAHLALLPPLPAHGGRGPMSKEGAGTEQGTASGVAALSREGARRLLEALAEGLEVRTGVVVTAVAATATGVKVSTDTAGTLTASAALLAVPHAVLKSGALALEPSLPAYRSAAAARVAEGGAMTLRLSLPPACSALLRRIGGGDTARPFAVAAAAVSVSSSKAEPSSTAEPGAASGVSSGLGLGLVFCPEHRLRQGGGEEGAGGDGDEPCFLEVHVTPSALPQAAAMSDLELQRQAMAALRAVAAAACGKGAAAGADDSPEDAAAEPSTASLPEDPSSFEVLRWGVSGPQDVASGSGRAGAAAAAAARGAACAHLAPGGDPRDMALLALPHKGRIFFAGEHTAPDQLRDGLLAALMASGVREAARLLKALKLQESAGSGGGSKAKAKAGQAAAAGLEVGDEPPHAELIGAAEAAAAAAVKAAKAAKEAAARAEKTKSKRSAQVIEDSDEEDGPAGADAAKRLQQAGEAKAAKAGRKKAAASEEEEDLEDAQRRQAALAKLQADRKDVKVVYKAMMAAGYGNLAPLREQMSTCAGLEAKQVLLQALQGATVPVLALMAGDSSVLGWLRDWLLELCDDSSAEHLVLAELRLLERLPLPADALAAALAALAATDGEDGAAGLAEQSGAVPPVRALVSAVRDRCGSHRGKDVKRMAAQVSATWERRGSGEVASGGGDAASRRDPALEAQLAAVKAAAEAARQEAALAAQRRAEVQQEAQAAAAAALPEIATFEDYKRVERGTGSGGGGGGSGSGSGSKHKEGGSSGKHHKSSSSSGGSAADVEALKAEVTEYVKQLLKRHHKSGRITTAGYRLILDKATRKVFETLTPGSLGGSDSSLKDPLGAKRREKIGKLVEQYVQKMGQTPPPQAQPQRTPSEGAPAAAPPPAIGVRYGPSGSAGCVGGANDPPAPTNDAGGDHPRELEASIRELGMEAVDEQPCAATQLPAKHA